MYSWVLIGFIFNKVLNFDTEFEKTKLYENLFYRIKQEFTFNLFLSNAPILYPLETPGVFRRCKMWTLTGYGLRDKFSLKEL